MNLRELVAGCLQTVAASAGESVSYNRSPHSATIVAIPGNSSAAEQARRGLAVSADEHDWLIPVADLRLNNAATQPQRGDRIVVERDGVDLTYTVLPRGSEPCYRLEATGTLYRIHTKLSQRD